MVLIHALSKIFHISSANHQRFTWYWFRQPNLFERGYSNVINEVIEQIGEHLRHC